MHACIFPNIFCVFIARVAFFMVCFCNRPNGRLEYVIKRKVKLLVYIDDGGCGLALVNFGKAALA